MYVLILIHFMIHELQNRNCNAMKTGLLAFCLLAFLKWKRVFAEEITLFTKSREMGPRLLYDRSIDMCRGRLRFDFRTFSKTAVVLYQDGGGEPEFISAALQDGYLHVRHAYPRSRKILNYTSPRRLDDFRWHSLEIRLRCPQPCFAVTVDGDHWYRDLDPHRCEFHSQMQIGGFSRERLGYVNSITDRETYKEIYLKRRGFFNACVRKIRYGENGGDTRPITSISQKYVKKGCRLTYCDKPDPVCKNNGRCTALGEGEDEVKCDCRWTGYTGEKCTAVAPDLTLNGTYKVRWQFEVGVAKESYKFRIRTRQENALIFDARGARGVDSLVFRIQSSRMLVTFNPGGNDVSFNITLDRIISDGEWHLVEYKKEKATATLIVDGIRGQPVNVKKRLMYRNEYSKMDYKEVYLGDTTVPYKHEVHIQDFIWEHEETNPFNYITALRDWCDDKNINYILYNKNSYFSTVPDGILPKLNKRCRRKRISPAPSTDDPTTLAECIGGEGRSCTSKVSTSFSPTPTSNVLTGRGEETSARKSDDDDSSVAWIVVVTVVFSLLLLAVIAFSVYKWNKRYSGDFQVNRKPIGPAGTVVHYQDAAHKEKQRQMKL